MTNVCLNVFISRPFLFRTLICHHLFQSEAKLHTCIKFWVAIYYDYQLSKARGKFGYEVLALKLWCCQGQLTLFPLVTISTAVGRLSRRLQFRALCSQ